jgi:hypothetical protein
MIAVLWDYLAKWFKPVMAPKPRKRRVTVKQALAAKKIAEKKTAVKPVVQCKKREIDGL